jgi:hypothetical protein
VASRLRNSGDDTFNRLIFQAHSRDAPIIFQHGDLLKMTFQEFVASRRITDTPCGDFVSDFRDDTAARRHDFKTWPQLRAYLRDEHHPCEEAFRAAQCVWREYTRHVRMRSQHN